MKKIKLTPSPYVKFEAARVTVILKDGRDFTESCDIARGNPLNPLSKEEIIDKFWTNVDFCGRIPKQNATELLQMLDNLEKLDSVRKLIPLLVA